MTILMRGGLASSWPHTDLRQREAALTKVFVVRSFLH